MALTWAQRREALLSDCIVFPDVFSPMIDRLAEFVVPYQQALETEVAQRNMHLYLQGLLSHLPRKNAEDIATFVDVQRQVIQEFIGTAPWDHRPLIEVLVPQVARRLGQPDGIIGGEIGSRTAGSLEMMSSVATRGFARSYASGVSAMCWGSLAPPRCVTSRPRHPSIKGMVGAQRPHGNQ